MSPEVTAVGTRQYDAFAITAVALTVLIIVYISYQVSLKPAWAGKKRSTKTRVGGSTKQILTGDDMA